MRTPEIAARLLIAGTLDQAAWPELHDEVFAREVRERLEAVGCELVAAGKKWLARPRPAETSDGFSPTFPLDKVELALIAALYLHLRFLPRQPSALGARNEEPSIELDELLRGFPQYGRSYLVKVLGRLRNAGFVRRDDHRIYAGPYLAAIDDVTADGRATGPLQSFAISRYLRRRAEELKTDAPDR